MASDRSGAYVAGSVIDVGRTGSDPTAPPGPSPAGSRVRWSTAISLMSGALVVVPSTALTEGPWRWSMPAVALALTLLLAASISVRSRPRPATRTGGPRRTPYWLYVLFTGILWLVATAIDPATDGVERLLGRALLVALALSISIAIQRVPQLAEALWRGLAGGALTLATVILISGVRGQALLGADVLPTRAFMMPLDLPKTSGVPMSFGEVGVALAAGVIYFLATYRGRTVVRVGLICWLLAAGMVAQSRNVLLVLVCAGALYWLFRSSRQRRMRAAIVTLMVFLSPVVVSLGLTMFDGRTVVDLQGEGIYRTNIETRTEQFGAVIDLDRLGGSLSAPSGTDRSDYLDEYGAVPHNHFLSLFILDGWAGIALLVVWWIVPVYRTIASGVVDGYVLWAVAAVIGLSFYEGAVSPVVPLAVGFVVGSVAGLKDRT